VLVASNPSEIQVRFGGLPLSMAGVVRRYLSLLIGTSTVHLAWGSLCLGAMNLDGFGRMSLISAEWNMQNGSAGQVQVRDGKIVSADISSRAFFGKACTGHDSFELSEVNLLGKRLRYTVDLSGAGCGCSAALHLVSMPRSAQLSDCSDHNCDAHGTCGRRCNEISIHNANRLVFHSALQTADDPVGLQERYGPGHGVHRTYGPRGRCIDTNKPFQVAASFPTDSASQLKAMEVRLTQEGKTCPLMMHLVDYTSRQEDYMGTLSAALRKGMTMVVSYSKEAHVHCGVGGVPICSTAVRFSAFAVESLTVPTDTVTSATLEGSGEAVLVSTPSSPNTSDSIIDLAEEPPARVRENSNSGSVFHTVALQMNAHSFLAIAGLAALFAAGLLLRACVKVMPVSQTPVRYAQLETPQRGGLGKPRSPAGSPAEC